MREFTFNLIPLEKDLQDLAAKFGEESSEIKAFEAGAAIADGHRTLENLVDIVKWKSPRSVWHIRKNTAELIDEVLKVAVGAAKSSSDEALVGPLKSLQKLQGVRLPIASAILTAINPERFTIIDFRALEALGHRRQDEEFYIAYLKFCRDIAAKNVVSVQQNLPAPTVLRALDRALWQWSKSQEKTT